MHFRGKARWFVLLLAIALVLIGVGAYLSVPRSYVLMSTTTSVRDTGLLPYLLPEFQADSGIEVRYTAVGTGQALDAGRRGDVDVVFVHAPNLEAAFVADGDGRCRNPVMYNRFVIVGPASDPAGISNATTVVEAFTRIHDTASRFESRADNSGTNNKELALWSLAGLDPATFGAWYEKTNQGMGSTLTIANERGAYTLSDDGTWYALESGLGFLQILYDQDEPDLRNQYSVIPVNPATHPAVHAEDALTFAHWMVRPRAQSLIAAFQINGHTIFTPNGQEMC
jgi:tungstate transport system substrate-binding protein